jgi:hypothetical protein
MDRKVFLVRWRGDYVADDVAMAFKNVALTWQPRGADVATTWHWRGSHAVLTLQMTSAYAIFSETEFQPI